MSEYLANLHAGELFLLSIGFLGQAMFSARFIVQWIASERKKRSVVPISFWYLSLAGSFFLLIYSIKRTDPVFILGQTTGSLVYLRNLYLIYKHDPAMNQSDSINQKS